MKRTLLLTVAAFTAALAFGPLSPSAPPIVAESNHVTTTIERRVAAADTPPLAELYQSVLSFEPSAFTVLHSHTGGSYNTVLQGAITLRIRGVDRTFGPGEGWTDEPGVLHLAGNTGSEGAQLLASMVVERGMPPVVVVDREDEDSAPPLPSLVTMTKTIAAVPAGPLDVVEQAVDLDASAEAGLPIPAGPRLIGVLDGSVTVVIDGVSHTFEAGDGWSEPTGATYSYTTGEAGARLAMTTLVPRSAPVAAAGE